MAITSKGKKWETKFKLTWDKTFNRKFAYRLPDQQSRYKGYSSNPSDFFALLNGKLLVIECKEHKGNTFPFSAFRQYEEMVELSKNYDDLICGILLWFSDHAKVVWCPIEEIKRIREDLDCKSINVKMVDNKEYNLITIPCRVPRTFPECDLTIFDKITKEHTND